MECMAYQTDLSVTKINSIKLHFIGITKLIISFAFLETYLKMNV